MAAIRHRSSSEPKRKRQRHGLLDASRSDSLDVDDEGDRSEEHTSELQSLRRISYAVFCLKKKNFFNDTATTEIYT